MHIRTLIKIIFQKIESNKSRLYLEQFLRDAISSIPANSLVLDAGAGDTPYRSLFTNMRYETADICQSEYVNYGHIDYVCDLTSIPVESDQYDVVICTQVLEHVPNPEQVLRELFRVLRPNGHLWITAPLFFAEHMEPYDYYRYTQYGLSYLLLEAGFKVERLERLEGYYATLAYQLATAAKSLPIKRKEYGGDILGKLVFLLAIPLKVQFLLLSLVFSRLEKSYKNVKVAYSKNYAVIAVKPDGVFTQHDIQI